MCIQRAGYADAIEHRASKFAQRLAQFRALVNDHYPRHVPEGHGIPAVLTDCMSYVLRAGGKRLRPLLTLFTADMLGVDPTRVMPTACAMEFMHTGSLMLDDLPCMDDAIYRRGQLTCHHVYGEANSILSSLGMLYQAFAMIIQNGAECGLSSAQLAELTQIILYYTGTTGAAAGQVIDLRLRGTTASLKVVEDMYYRKTSTLMILPVAIAARLCRAPHPVTVALESYAAKLGLAFQVLDDILDATGSIAKLGKDVAQDPGRPTFASLLGIESSRRYADERLREARRALDGFEDECWAFLELLEFVRSYGQDGAPPALARNADDRLEPRGALGQ